VARKIQSKRQESFPNPRNIKYGKTGIRYFCERYLRSVEIGKGLPRECSGLR
jgi:hypothetical protein